MTDQGMANSICTPTRAKASEKTVAPTVPLTPFKA